MNAIEQKRGWARCGWCFYYEGHTDCQIVPKDLILVCRCCGHRFSDMAIKKSVEVAS